MFVFKELLVLTVLVLFELEVHSANTAVLKEANSTQVDDTDSAELEYRMLHNKKSRKILAKLLEKFLEKLYYDSDESQEKQKPPRSKTTKISRILTTEKDNFMDIGTYTSTSTSPILEQSTEKSITNSKIEATNNDESHRTEPSITKDEIISKTTPSLDDVTNPKHSEDDHALSNETLVTDKNEEKNNPSTLMTSNEVTIATSTEIPSLPNSSTEDYHTSSDSDSTTQLPFTVPTTGFTYNLFPENVLDRPSLEELDNDSNTTGISDSFMENPDIFNSTESIISNNISSTTSIQDVTENTQNIGLSDLNPENIMTTPKPIILTNTNNVSIVKISEENFTDEPKIPNLTDKNVTASSTIISNENINEVAVIDNMTSIEAFNTTVILETRKQLDELNDTNTTPDSNEIKYTDSTSASTSDTNVSSQETNTTNLLHNEHIHWESEEVLNTKNPNELNGTTMKPSDNSTELVNSSTTNSEEESTTQSTDWTVSLNPDKLDNNYTSITKPPIDNFTEDVHLDFTKNIELTTTELPITGLTDNSITTTPDNITSLVAGKPVEDYKTDNISSEIAKDISGSVDENSKEDNNTSVPEKDIDLDSSLPIESINYTTPMPIVSTSESLNDVGVNLDTSESEINVNKTKIQEHYDQEIDTNEPVHNDPINTSLNGTAAIDNSDSFTEDRKQLKNNTLIIISLQDPIDKPANTKNSLQRLFMMMMMYY